MYRCTVFVMVVVEVGVLKLEASFGTYSAPYPIYCDAFRPRPELCVYTSIRGRQKSMMSLLHVCHLLAHM